ncbi:MAG: ribonuclease HII [Oligoflexia bacterium]|nr:ribonuclease HII [Oligoflexia bacterium]
MGRHICGVDEVGRGPLAGPVVAAAAVFEEGYCNPEIKDSKQLSPQKREQLVERIKADALGWAIVSVGHHRIEQLNIREASRLAMSLAVQRVQADFVLVDGNVPIFTELPQRTVVKGDALHVEISAASILAKVFRDNLMKTLDLRYPGYELGHHAGYPTPKHKAAIARLGPSPVHRRTFAGVKEHVGLSQNISLQSQHQQVV